MRLSGLRRRLGGEAPAPPADARRVAPPALGASQLCRPAPLAPEHGLRQPMPVPDGGRKGPRELA
eukprot:11639687-Alexandrium_andersonii.AAC.1